MMRVQSKVASLMPLVSQRARLAVIAMPGERPKGSKNPAGSHLLVTCMPWSSVRFTGGAGDSHPSSPSAYVAMVEEVAVAEEEAMTE